MHEKVDPTDTFAPELKRIAIFRALNLGDFLVSTPALRAVRRRHPQAELTLIGLPWTRQIVERFGHLIDRLIEFPGYPGIAEEAFEPERTRRFLIEQQRYGYDLALQMHGSGRTSNKFVHELGAATSAGFYDQEQPVRLDFDAPYPDDISEIDRCLKVASLAGCQGENKDLEFPIHQSERRAARAIAGLSAARRIIVHPGANYPSRRWPAGHFAALADRLSLSFECQVILTGAPVETDLVQEIERRMTGNALNLAGKTSLGELAALIEQAELFIGNDTGPAHLASAVGTPSVILFGPADPVRWAPSNPRRHHVVRRPVPCSPCGFRECPIDHRCLRHIDPDRVFRTAEELLSEVRAA